MNLPKKDRFSLHEIGFTLVVAFLLIVTGAAWNLAIYQSLVATIFGDSQEPVFWSLLCGAASLGLSLLLLAYGAPWRKRREP